MAMTQEERLLKLREQLLEVETAISAIQSGAQEYSIANRSLKRADLATLYTERSRLEKEIEALESGTGMFRRVYFEGR
ncbi:hypothetical protein UY286_08675 [Paenibacillus polymyxa]|uniref:hypothetical protein n=1 Tax=Paenibacillus polymyxa TaxID=1406 RepID=UPI002AB45B17|nr:hypothetical protein [Paenibacillus polymyxa]MDY7990677.1 hypothetical protein [Paenibacillus polymyxa]MDY8117512.1 hypothetical protein [Paenibacillus polymyxa]